MSSFLSEVTQFPSTVILTAVTHYTLSNPTFKSEMEIHSLYQTVKNK